MLLIIILGLIAKLALVYCDCDFGPLPLEDFDITKVGIGVLTCILEQTVVKTVAWFYISFMVPLTKCP